ncbi:hypothetical protein BT69DRAFT_575171 [Atractiella rhizophila]|nr:hypothetical protein BT69DRAFT_575171 [Atractiella rhizophila]
MTRPSKRFRPSLTLSHALLSLNLLAPALAWNFGSMFSSKWNESYTDDDVSWYGDEIQVVVVGGEAGLVFTPPVIHAPVGARILFEFQTKNHTVTQSSFDEPCKPLDGGFKSGFLPSQLGNSSQTGPGFVVEVQDTKPIWFYCGQQLPQPHCPQGMVGAINPPSKGNTFDEFKKKALALADNGGYKSSSSTSEAISSSNGWTTNEGGSGKNWGGDGSSEPEFHVVVVGGEAGLVYTPDQIDAPIGSRILFEFQTKNHTVTQSSFDEPCKPLEGGFKSGFQPSQLGNSSQTGPGFVVEVKDDKPIWFYCGQQLPKPHCPQGMVGAINAPKTGNTFDEFKKKALALADNGGYSSSSNSQPTTSNNTWATNNGSSEKNWGGDGSSEPEFHVVVVGGEAGLVYTPNQIDAPIGSRILFEFQTKNHTVTQSSFDEPCKPLDGGFKSGFQPSQLGNSSQTGPGFVVEVKDDKPIWFYCGQQLPQPHCPQGMVGAINAPKQGNTFEKFLEKAKASGGSGGSGGSGPVTGGNPPPQGQKTRCDVSDVALTFQQGSNLTFPSNEKLNFVTVGRGTQNYTCTNGKFTSIGAVATLLDISCYVDEPYFLDIPAISLGLDRPTDIAPAGVSTGNPDILSKFSWDAIEAVKEIQLYDLWTFKLGDHFFVPFPKPDSKPLPKFTFEQVLGEGQFITGNLTASDRDPVDPVHNVAWLQLAGVDGHLSTELYRIVTAGGQPIPSECHTEGQVATFEYAAFYVFSKVQY